MQRMPQGTSPWWGFPIINTAKNDIGRAIVANIVALGAMVALTGAVTRESAEKAVLSRVPEAFVDLNRRAFLAGYEKALAAKGQGGFPA